MNALQAHYETNFLGQASNLPANHVSAADIVRDHFSTRAFAVDEITNCLSGTRNYPNFGVGLRVQGNSIHKDDLATFVKRFSTWIRK